MKKNILSLVAFMAFSVGAFANTIEIKEEVVVLDKVEVLDVETNNTPPKDCFTYGINVYNQAENAGITDWSELNWYMNIAIAICEGWSFDDIVF